MEKIKYSNQKVDSNILGKREVCLLYDSNGEYLKKMVPQITELSYNPLIPTWLYLKLSKQRTLTKVLIEEFELPKSLLKKTLKKLSVSELLKVQLIKTLASKAETIILNNVDTCLVHKDLLKIKTVVKTQELLSEKNVIFVSNNIDRLLFLDRFIFIQEDNIIYNGKDISKFPIEPETIEFAKLANEKGAKIDFYKDPSDLLKAIYRDIK